MDLFDSSQLDSAGKPIQIHDFNPGTIDAGPAKGLFWTTHITTSAVHVDLDEASAVMRVHQQDVEDYGTLKNALLDGPSDPATVSFVMQWHGVKARLHVRDLLEHFVTDRIEGTATATWSAAVPSKNFTFASDPAATSTSVFAEIGAERNGVFFR